MSKQALWISLVLTAMCASLILLFDSLLPKTMRRLNSDDVLAKMSRITYIFHRPNDKQGPIFSLSPDHSDATENTMILNGLIGTLVKFDGSGRIEPYIAESWSKSPDGRRWEFKLRADLFCEDGSLITATGFVDQLRLRLKTYALKSKVMVFDQLRGWDDFLIHDDSSRLGLKSEGSNKVIFEFTRESHELLEFLRMVYFGFWCDANFKEGRFRDDGRFVSSGAYRLKDNEGGRKIVLTKNPGWFSVAAQSTDEIEFTVRNVEGEVGRHEKTIIRLGVSAPEPRDVESFHVIRTEPVILSAFILSPWTSLGFFKIEKNRRLFQARLQNAQFPSELEAEGIYHSPNFYSNSPGSLEPVMLSTSTYEAKLGPILVSLPSRLGRSAGGYMRRLILDLLAEVRDQVEFANVDMSDPAAQKKLTSNSHFDIRVSSVDIGGNITNSLIDMMFCTSMGVSFPDPSGRICRLVREYNNLGKEADHAYVDNFNRIVVDDAYVLPVFHSGLTTLYSKDFDVKTIPTGSSHPRFEDFRFEH